MEKASWSATLGYARLMPGFKPGIHVILSGWTPSTQCVVPLVSTLPGSIFTPGPMVEEIAIRLMK